MTPWVGDEWRTPDDESSPHGLSEVRGLLFGCLAILLGAAALLTVALFLGWKVVT